MQTTDVSVIQEYTQQEDNKISHLEKDLLKLNCMDFKIFSYFIDYYYQSQIFSWYWDLYTGKASEPDYY